MISICQSAPLGYECSSFALGGPALPKNIISQLRCAELFLTAAHHQRRLQMSAEKGIHEQPLTRCTVDTEFPAGVWQESVSGKIVGYNDNSWNRLVGRVPGG